MVCATCGAEAGAGFGRVDGGREMPGKTGIRSNSAANSAPLLAVEQGAGGPLLGSSNAEINIDSAGCPTDSRFISSNMCIITLGF